MNSQHQSPNIIELRDHSKLYNWLDSLPAESIERLKQINRNAGSAQHVILAIAYGIKDQNVRKLNRMIIGLLIKRMQAERQGQGQTIQRITSFMKVLHYSIDRITGINTAINGDRSACNRIGRQSFRHG